ncbi:Protein byr4 [Yarrowia sp. C11]|nr:Protein byr4 [Yarrowia sp. E02]KAG5369619.1 Protein byr4 [Yarrowia sp. C11]
MENWDDDFGDEADLVLRASTSTISSSEDNDFGGLIHKLGTNATSTTKSPIKRPVTNMKNFRSLDDMPDFTTLKTVLSDDDFDGFDDFPTIKGNPLTLKPQLKLKETTQTKSQTNDIDWGDDFEDGFDLPTDFTPLSVRKKTIYPSGIDMPEPVTPTRSPSKGRDSPATSIFSPTSSNYSETDAPEGDMCEGFDLPTGNLDSIDLEKVLAERQRAAEAEAEAEAAQWQQRPAQDDFFDGIELNDDSFVNVKATVNKNILKNGKSMGKLQKRRASQNNLGSSTRGLSHMPSLPSLKPALRLNPSLKSASNTRQIRPAQSMVNIRDRRKQDTVKVDSLDNLRKYNTVKTLSRPKSRIQFDGFELDEMEDLDVARDAPRDFGTVTRDSVKPLEAYRESTVRNPTYASMLKAKGPASREGGGSRDGTIKARDWQREGGGKAKVRESRFRSKLGLIKPLGNTYTPPPNSNMSFNPTTMMWEGNDVDLKRFESAKPALLAFKSTKGAQVVGNMYFDPVKLCWKSMEVDIDELEGLDDLEEEPTSIGFGGRGFSGAADGREFELSDEFVSKLKHQEERWNRKTSGWFEVGAKFDRDYLWDLRKLITNTAKK